MITSRSRVPTSMSSNKIVFFDTTLRDGEQSSGCTMHNDEKLRMAHQLAALGVDVLEAGFAIASQGDSDSIRRIAREVRGTRIASLARCKREDIEAAARAVEPAEKSRIHTFLASSDLHLEAKLKITRAEALHQAAEAVRLARTFADDVEFSAEDATRTDPDSSSRSSPSRSRPEPPPSTSPTPSVTPHPTSTPPPSACSSPRCPASKT